MLRVRTSSIFYSNRTSTWRIKYLNRIDNLLVLSWLDVYLIFRLVAQIKEFSFSFCEKLDELILVDRVMTSNFFIFANVRLPFHIESTMVSILNTVMLIKCWRVIRICGKHVYSSCHSLLKVLKGAVFKLNIILARGVSFCRSYGTWAFITLDCVAFNFTLNLNLRLHSCKVLESLYDHVWVFKRTFGKSFFICQAHFMYSF